MAAKKLKARVANSSHTRGGRLFKVGDEIEVTQAEVERYPGKFVLPGGAAPAASSGGAAAAVKRAEVAEARVAELEAELAAAAEKALKTTPSDDGKGKSESKAKGK